MTERHRRQKGTGTIREVRPGVWRIRAYVGPNDAGRPVQQTKTVRGTKRQAEAALKTLVADADKINVKATETTVGELLDQFMEQAVLRLEPTTIRGYRTHVAALKKEIGAVPLHKLTARQIDLAYAAWLNAGRKPGTVQYRHAVLRAALHQAQKWDLITSVVTDKATPPSLEASRLTPPTPAEVQKLVSEAEKTNKTLSAVIFLAAITGCRRGEICGLRWTDVDWQNRVLHVRRSAKEALDGPGVVTRDTKTHQDRKLALPAEGMLLLQTHWARVNEVAARCDRHLVPNAYIFSLDNDGATPLHPAYVTKAFTRLRTKVGVKVRFHDLRHFTATQLLSKGIDPRTVAGRLGHRDPSLTMRVYAAWLELPGQGSR